MALTGFLLKKLREALQTAFDVSEFERFLEEELEVNLSEIARGESEADFFYNALRDIQRGGLREKFLNKVFQNKLENEKIKEFCPIYQLAKILNQISNFEQIKSIYIQTIGNVDDETLTEVETINDILEKLTDFPTFHNKPSKMVEFVRHLHGVSQKLNIPQDLVEQWLKDYDKDYDPEPSEGEKISSSGEELQSYLLITVASEATDTKGEFSLEAELIVDYSHAPQERNPIHAPQERNPIDLDANESEAKCTREKLSEKIAKFVNKAESHLIGKNFFLTVELLLPRACIGDPFDIDIKVLDENDELRSLGEKYAVIVRSYERNKDANAISKLRTIYKNRTQLCQNILDFDALQELSQCQWRRLALSWEQKEKLGIKLLCCLPPPVHETRENFFKAVNKGGLLLALWSRGGDFKLQRAFNDILSRPWIENFINLYQAILEIRKQAHAEETNAPQFLGYHLGILCDEPHRIPTCLDNPFKLRIGK
jgi:hypothetical protein